MNEWWQKIVELFQDGGGTKLLRAFVMIFVGYGVARLSRVGLNQLITRYGSPVQARVLSRAAFYLIFGLFLLSSLRQMGFKINFLIGAAGLFTVAIGFAAQASVSQLISGWFLAAERAFDIGDTVKIGKSIGKVMAIDMISVKLRTLDNVLIRIPNESVVKSQVSVLSKFPIRRVTVKIAVAYGSDLEHVKRVLLAVADQNPTVMDEPKPHALFRSFADSGIDVELRVFTKQGEGFVAFKSTMHQSVHDALRKAGIEIPFPHRVVITPPPAVSVGPPLAPSLAEPPTVSPAAPSAADAPAAGGS